MKHGFFKKLTSAVLAGAMLLTGMAVAPETTKAAGVTLTEGSIYEYAGCDWMVTEINGDCATMVMTAGNVNEYGDMYGTWPGYHMSGTLTNADGDIIDVGSADNDYEGDTYEDDIGGYDIHEYNDATKKLYDVIKDDEYTSASYGKGLYLVPNSYAEGSGLYGEALTAATKNCYSFGDLIGDAWLGTCFSGSSYDGGSYRASACCVNSDGSVGSVLQDFSYVVAPAFNLDTSKVNQSEIRYICNLTTEFTTMFEDYDGTSISKKTDCHYSDKLTIPSRPTRTGYTFKGWSTDGSNTISFIEYRTVTRNNTTYKAAYIPINYTVEFQDYDGTSLSKKAGCHYGDSLTAPSDPPRDGYTFKGWSTDGKTVITLPTKVTGDATYKAVYEALSSYNVTYEFVSGTAGKTLPSKVTALLPAGTTAVEGTTVTATQPVQTSVAVGDGTWTFGGYDKTTATASQDIKFTGTWNYTDNSATPNNVTLTEGHIYQYAGCDWMAVKVHNNYTEMVMTAGNVNEYGDMYGTWPGYHMSGTLTNADGNTIDVGSADRVYANSIDGYDIHEYNEATKKLYNAIKDDEYTSADYGKGLYLVSNLKAGTISDTAPSSGYYGQALTDAAKNHSSFGASNTYAWLGTCGTNNIGDNSGSWYVSQNGNVCNCYFQDPSDVVVAPAFNLDTSKVSADEIHDLTAEHTVDFQDYDRTSISKKTDYHYGDNLTAPSDPARTGYTFKGWSTDGSNVITLPATVTGDATYKAVYTPIDYTVDFQNYDGTSLSKKADCHYGDILTAPSNPTRTGYTFKGWSTDGSNVITLPATVTGDATYKAVYEAIPNYNVTYEFVSGTTGKTLPAEVTALLPAGTTAVEGSTVTATQPVQTSVAVAGGTWTFGGYDKATATADQDVKFTGTWNYQDTPTVEVPTTATGEYNISYEFKSGTSGKTLPADIEKLKPADKKVTVTGSAIAITPDYPEKTSVDTDKGTWTFAGYSSDTADKNIKFTGTWNYADKANNTPSGGNGGGSSSGGNGGNSTSTEDASDVIRAMAKIDEAMANVRFTKDVKSDEVEKVITDAIGKLKVEHVFQMIPGDRMLNIHVEVFKNVNGETVSRDNTYQFFFNKFVIRDGKKYFYDMYSQIARARYIQADESGDGFTYFADNSGAIYQDRLSYDPTGKDVIYFDADGHMAFDKFINIKHDVLGNPVDYIGYFDTFGRAYVNKTTYGNGIGQYGKNDLFYINDYGVLQQNGWFKNTEGNIGYAAPNGRLTTSQWGIDQFGRKVYFQANGFLAKGTLFDGTRYYNMDVNDGYLTD